MDSNEPRARPGAEAGERILAAIVHAGDIPDRRDAHRRALQHVINPIGPEIQKREKCERQTAPPRPTKSALGAFG